MVKLTINNQEVEVEEGTTVLQAARRLGIDVPTLCAHEALMPYGACRVCLVELVFNKRSKLTTSCTYPVWEGLVVRTDSEKVIQARRFVAELLLAHCPDVVKIRELAEKIGVKETKLKKADEDCILCGLCVRVCGEIIGSSAISFINRGIERVVETPFETGSEDCIGCGACAMVCPTGAIKIEDKEKELSLSNWNTKLEKKKCRLCNRYFSTIAHIEYIKTKVELPRELFDTCPECRRKAYRKKFVELIEKPRL